MSLFAVASERASEDARSETADTFLKALELFEIGWDQRCLEITCLCMLSFLLNDFSQTEENQLMSTPQEQNVDWERGRMLRIDIVLKAIKFNSFPPPPPPPPQFYCFPSTTTTAITYFYCFPSTTTTATTILLFSLHHHHRHHISIVFPPPPPPHFYCFPSTTTTTTTFLGG